LEGAVVFEIEARELADAEFGVDVHAGVDFFARIAVSLESVFGFEELELSGVWGLGRGCGFSFRFCSMLLRSLLRLRRSNI